MNKFFYITSTLSRQPCENQGQSRYRDYVGAYLRVCPNIKAGKLARVQGSIRRFATMFRGRTVNMELFIIKRNGKKESFSIEKIKNAISKAFLSVGVFATQDVLGNILCRLNIANHITVEEIQNQVEVALMAERYYAVAKAYILYRQKHLEDRDIRDKLNFLINYCDASNAASGSKFDANANVENKNISTLIGELPKSSFIRLNRRMLTDRLKEMFGKEIADKYIGLLNNHYIYKNDETSLANYCASITMYPWLTGGTTSIGGNSKPPTNLRSFSGGFVNMVFMVSSMLSGACATPEFLMYMNYFIGLEYGQDYYLNISKVVDLSKKQRTIDKIITDHFEQIVYSINQPTGARNFQAVFWNISYYDRYYFESIFGNFVFPNGSKPDWESLNWLQKRKFGLSNPNNRIYETREQFFARQAAGGSQKALC